MSTVTLMQSSYSFDNTPTATSKKAKKNALKNATTPYNAVTTNYNDQAALSRRAERFQREHELERTKHTRIGGEALKANHQTAHLFGNSRSGSPYVGNDEPEGDPVSLSDYFGDL